MSELTTLFCLAALLELKHGFDANHLAAIDGLARLQASAGRARLARLSGFLFSAGHGAVVVLAGLWLGGRVEALPSWLDGAGGCISIVFLATLGVVNLREACRPTARGTGGSSRRGCFDRHWRGIRRRHSSSAPCSPSRSTR